MWGVYMLINTILEFLTGFAIGAGVVGSSVARTTAVQDGKFKDVCTTSLVNSVSYGASIYFIAAGHWVAYTGTALGGLLVCLYMASYSRRKGIKK